MTNSIKRSTLHQLDGSEYDITTGISTPKMAVDEFEDENMENRDENEFQWDFLPKIQFAGPDRVLNAFLLGLEKTYFDRK